MSFGWTCPFNSALRMSSVRLQFDLFQTFVLMRNIGNLWFLEGCYTIMKYLASGSAPQWIWDTGKHMLSSPSQSIRTFRFKEVRLLRGSVPLMPCRSRTGSSIVWPLLHQSSWGGFCSDWPRRECCPCGRERAEPPWPLVLYGNSTPAQHWFTESTDITMTQSGKGSYDVAILVCRLEDICEGIWDAHCEMKRVLLKTDH